MPIRQKDFEKALDLRRLKEEIVDRLGNIAAQLKLVQEEEVATNGGRDKLEDKKAYQVRHIQSTRAEPGSRRHPLLKQRISR